MKLDDTPWPDLLGHFLPASPGLIAQRELRRRADAKYLLSPRAAAELLSALNDDYAVLTAGTALLAEYRTLYFDTAALDFFHGQRRGRRIRHKVRIRHYPDRRLSLLEVKTRRSELETSKVWRARPYGDSELTAEDQVFIAGQTGCGQPVVAQAWTEFRRVALLGLHTNERITVDLDISVSAGPLRRSFGDLAILEVKQWPYLRDTAVVAALRAAGRRPTGISKYCYAIAFTRPSVRCNLLLPGLRALERAA